MISRSHKGSALLTTMTMSLRVSTRAETYPKMIRLLRELLYPKLSLLWTKKWKRVSIPKRIDKEELLARTRPAHATLHHQSSLWQELTKLTTKLQCNPHFKWKNQTWEAIPSHQGLKTLRVPKIQSRWQRSNSIAQILRSDLTWFRSLTIR